MEIKVVLGFKKASSSNRKNEIQKEIKGIERGKSKMVDYAPGMRTIIRDTELNISASIHGAGINVIVIKEILV